MGFKEKGYDTAKEYLSEISKFCYLKNNLMRKMNELECDKVSIGAIRYDKERVDTSPQNVQDEKIIRLIELQDEYNAQIQAYHEASMARVKQISQLSRPEYVKILALRFVDLHPTGRIHSLAWIADELGYSEDRIRHMYSEALDEFSEKFA